MEEKRDRTFIRDYLSVYYDEVEPMEFYKGIFPDGELEEAGERIQGKYNAIALELLPRRNDSRENVKKYLITDGLVALEKLLKSNNFVIISPISYAGRSRQGDNARFIFALAIDLDGIREESNLNDLFHQIQIGYLPKPTNIVWSGTGLHLYYQFVEPIPCFKNITNQLATLKRELTRKIWNKYVSELADKPQIESLFQGFRLVGGITKGGNRTKCFAIGDKVSIEYLNSFVPEEFRVFKFTYKSKLTLKEAKEKYPEWYERRIIKKQKRGTWVANEAVYNWWLKQLKEKVSVGHRYYSVMVLAVYAKKCGISKERLENDAFELVRMLDDLTIDEKNHFTREDVLSALEMFNDNYITFPINSIVNLTAIPIEKNKRNGRKQDLHLKLARATKKILREAGELVKDGRPSKKDDVIKWRIANPDKKIKDCVIETAISENTVRKYWKMGVKDL